MQPEAAQATIVLQHYSSPSAKHTPLLCFRVNLPLPLSTHYYCASVLIFPFSSENPRLILLYGFLGVRAQVHRDPDLRRWEKTWFLEVTAPC